MGVDSSSFSFSLECDPDLGILRKDRFFFGSTSGLAGPSPPLLDLEPVLARSSVEGGPREDDRGGGIIEVELGPRSDVERN